MLIRHAAYTGSESAKQILNQFEEELAHFVYVIPNEYEVILRRMEELQETGKSHDEAELAAFYELTTEAPKVQVE